MLVCVDSPPLILQTPPPEFHHLHHEGHLCFPSQLYCHSQHILLNQPLVLDFAVANENTTLLSHDFISRFPPGSEVSSLPCPSPLQCETDISRLPAFVVISPTPTFNHSFGPWVTHQPNLETPDGQHSRTLLPSAPIYTGLFITTSPATSTPVASTSADSASKPVFDSDEIYIDTMPHFQAAVFLSSLVSSENFFLFSMAQWQPFFSTSIH